MSQIITEKEILDLAAKIAVQAIIDGIEKSQIENLLASVEIPSVPENVPWVVALYAHRQAGRGRIKHRTAKLIYEAMKKLSEAGAGKEDVRKLLGLVKWIYESFAGKKENMSKIDVMNLSLQDVLEILNKMF